MQKFEYGAQMSHVEACKKGVKNPLRKAHYVYIPYKSFVNSFQGHREMMFKITRNYLTNLYILQN